VYPGAAQSLSTPNISGTGKATDFKFGWYIHGVYSNESPLNSFEKRERGRLQGLSKIFKYPLLSQERVKLQTSNFTIDYNKSTLTISGKVAVGVARDSRNFSEHPYIGRIARFSLR